MNPSAFCSESERLELAGGATIARSDGSGDLADASFYVGERGVRVCLHGGVYPCHGVDVAPDGAAARDHRDIGSRAPPAERIKYRVPAAT